MPMLWTGNQRDHYLGTVPCKPKIFRKRVRKAIISGMKRKEQMCEENRLKVQ